MDRFLEAVEASIPFFLGFLIGVPLVLMLIDLINGTVNFLLTLRELVVR